MPQVIPVVDVVMVDNNRSHCMFASKYFLFERTPTFPICFVIIGGIATPCLKAAKDTRLKLVSETNPHAGTWRMIKSVEIWSLLWSIAWKSNSE